MQLKTLIEKTGFECLTSCDHPETEVNGVYCGDLLSWVMGNGKPEQAWITVQVHMNVIAVAMLREFSCIIFAEDATVTPEILEKAKEEHCMILASHMPAYETALKCRECGI